MVHTAGVGGGPELGSGDGGVPPSPGGRDPLHRRVARRVSRFADRYPFAGPFVWMSAILFFVAQVVVAYSWRSAAASPKGIVPDHPYSLFANTISDLGETAKFTYGTPAMWSPLHVWMNLAFVLLGAVMIIGSPLIYQEFNEGDAYKVWIARLAFSAQVLAGVGAVFVGLNPENEHPLLHVVGAGLAIAVGTLGVFLLGLSLPLPGRLRRFMIFCMPVALVAIALFALHEYLGFGPGGMERLATYPEVIWLISFGFYLSRSHYKDNSAHRALESVYASRPSRGVDPKPDPIPARLRFPARGRLANGRVNSPYRTELTVLGGTGQEQRFTVNAGVAPGLDLSADGRISGSPTEQGRNRLHAEAGDSGGVPVRKTYTLRVRR